MRYAASFLRRSLQSFQRMLVSTKTPEDMMQATLTHETQVQASSHIEVTFDPKRRPPRLWELIRPTEAARVSHHSDADLAALELELRQQCQQSNWAGVTALWHQVVVTKHKLAKIGKLA